MNLKYLTKKKTQLAQANKETRQIWSFFLYHVKAKTKNNIDDDYKQDEMRTWNNEFSAIAGEFYGIHTAEMPQQVVVVESRAASKGIWHVALVHNRASISLC